MARAGSADILKMTVALLVIHTEPQPRAIREWNVHHALELAHIVVARRSFHITFELIRGFAWYQQHRSTGGIATEQRSLRALQDLDVFQIEHHAGTCAVAGGLGARTPRRHHVCKIHSDGGGGA